MSLFRVRSLTPPFFAALLSIFLSGIFVYSSQIHKKLFSSFAAGCVDVLVDGVLVNTMPEGLTFGEKALENDAPRSATVCSVVPTKLLLLLASDYKMLAAYTQAKVNEELAGFLKVSCVFL
jgi:hypothetical protein